MTPRYLIAALAALVVVGCAQQPTATRETLLRATAVVDSVDQSTRQVRLTDQAGGGTFTVTAGPEVRNLAQLAAGDEVQVDYYEAVTVAMANPDDPPAEAAVLAGRAPEGALPAGVAAVTSDVVVTLQSYDATSGLATFVTPDGLTRSVTVAPEMRDFAAARSPGDRIRVTITEAVAVTITENAA